MIPEIHLNENETNMNPIKVHRYPDLDSAENEHPTLPALQQGEEAKYPAWSNTFTGVNSSDKKSLRAENCLVVIMAGTSQTGEEVSMLAHLTPNIVKSGLQRKIARILLYTPGAHLQARLESGFRYIDTDKVIQQKDEEASRGLKDIFDIFDKNTIKQGRNVGIVGGSLVTQTMLPADYEKLLTKVKKGVRKYTGVTPSVLLPPKEKPGTTDVYYSTKNRMAVVIQK